MKKKELKRSVGLLYDESSLPKLVVEEKNFYIDEKNGTVVCVLKCWFDTFKLIACDGNEVTVKGVAKCHKDDTFDIVVGKRIASAKAEIEAYRQAKILAREYARQAQVIVNRFKKVEQNMDEYVDVNKKFIVKVGGLY